jgi:D-3-phosphoglycerate dehydrogenase
VSTPLKVPRVIICDDLHPAALEKFLEHGIEAEVRTGMDEAALIRAVPGVNALVVRSATKITRAVLEAAGDLVVVGRAGVGVDNVDVTAATERGVVVMNTPTGNTTTTGELAIALLCSLARHVPQADRSTRSGNWKKKNLMGTEITGKVLGVIGLGRIGRVVAQRAAGLRMEVVAHDPYLSQEGLLKSGLEAGLEGIELLELDDLLQRSDFVTLHVPLTDETRGLLGAERLGLMKPGARLINCARGGLVDEAALAVALDEGRLAGAALDVLEQEPPPEGHPLLGRDNVILTPHLGASSHEAQRNVAVDVAEQIATFLEDDVARNAVNAPALPASMRRELAPYLLLAERMGSYLAQRMDAPIRKVEFTLAGEVASKDQVGALRLGFLVALLRRSLEGSVNFVNAPLLASERDMHILEDSEGSAGNYTNLIKVRVSSENGRESHVVSGTVFGNDPRFVRVDDMHVDLTPEGHLLLTRHTDQPGVLGQIGTLLGEEGINVSRVELGPHGADLEGQATAFFSLYDMPSERAIERVRALDTVHSARHIDLGG